MGDTATVWNVIRVRARREHVCAGCRHPICVGTQHDRIGRLYEGEWDTLRLHLECHELARRLGAESGDDGYQAEDLRGQLDDLRSMRHHEPWVVRAWRGLLRARLREQRGRPDLCADGTWPPLPEQHNWDHTLCSTVTRWGRDLWGRWVPVQCATDAARRVLELEEVPL